MILDYLPKNWKDLLNNEIECHSFKQLTNFLNFEYQAGKTIFPPATLLFNAFQLCSFESVQVVIIGQDPYHAPGLAHGLSFSVNDGVKFPPSLKNIFKELQQDLGIEPPFSGNLSCWAQQGVLLLNAILTVESGKPGSHKQKGWEQFTDSVIQLISREKKDVVFLLWGNYAIHKAVFIDDTKHLILKAAHPSPLARGAFFGCKHFSNTNNYLVSKGKLPINW